MGRENKFKAFVSDPIHGKGVYEVRSIQFFPLVIDVMIDGEIVSFFDFDNVELLQYTGLKDKNGVEIYEGYILKNIRFNQILKVTWQEAVEIESLDGVRWMAEKPGFRFEKIGNGMAYVYTSDTLEVIGNIYEHPHLLEG